jgi:hypothetical protein
MACPQDEDEGKVSIVEGSYKYIKKTVMDSGHMEVLKLGCWARC